MNALSAEMATEAAWKFLDGEGASMAREVLGLASPLDEQAEWRVIRGLWERMAAFPLSEAVTSRVNWRTIAGRLLKPLFEATA